MNIAMTSEASTPQSSPPFDPAAWLARYVDLGGGYSMVGDAIWLHWLLSANVDEAAIQAHERVLRGRPDWGDAVKALIMQSVAREVVDG